MTDKTYPSLMRGNPATYAWYALGRNAMFSACRMVGIEAHDQILTPAFNCDGALQPFRALKAAVTFVASDPDTFTIDLRDLKKKITPRTKLLHIINHFGFPQPWQEIVALSQERKIPVLEDNAYSLFSSYNNRQFGDFGDFAVFSLRKNLPLVHGGMLKINTSAYSIRSLPDHAPLLDAHDLGALCAYLKRKIFNCLPRAITGPIKKLISSAGIVPPLFSDAYPGIPVLPGRDAIGKEFSCNYERPMCGIARFLLKRYRSQDLDQIASLKRQYYMAILSKLKGLRGVKLLWPELPEGIVPFSVSLMVLKKRDSWYEALRKNYEIMTWPTLPMAIVEQLASFPEVELLGRQLLQINLPSDWVVRRDFPEYVRRLVIDLYRLSERYA